MVQKHRISTEIGKDQLIKVELKQDFDLLEILSLKFSQQQTYSSFCADYGVVCGRISVNNGFGVPNARVSIFVPLKEEHINDPVISSLYPYKTISDKDDNNYRYNLLPKRQQHSGHQPTGTFPDQEDILTQEAILEVYENYYTYTVKTNMAGDFMIWGVPLGTQTLHVDVDLSDIGCFSLRPYDFIRQGKGVDNFKNKYKFKASEDLTSLPQIVTFDKSIEVYPFWGSEDYCEIGISRADFDLSDKGVKIEPKAYLIGGVFTDNGKNSVNKNCTPRKKMGRKCDLVTKSAKIEAIRFTPQKDENHRPYLEEYDLHEDISEDGGFMMPLPMNMDYVYTDEFGDIVITNDPNKGIATSACYRIRINIDDNGLSRVRANADYLIPNIREYISGSTIDDKSYAFSTDWNDYPIPAVSNDSSKGILYSENGEYYPKDYFYRFNYNKVYTLSSFQSHYIKQDYTGALIGGAVGGPAGAAIGATLFGKNQYVGLKELVPPEEEDCDNLIPPVNFATKNYTFTLLIADFLLILDFVFKWLTLMFLNTMIFLLGGIGDFLEGTNIGWANQMGHQLQNWLSSVQRENTTKLSLINYPDCSECSSESQPVGISGGGISCIMATFQITGSTNSLKQISNFTIYNDTDCGATGTTITDIHDLIARQDVYAVVNLNNSFMYLNNGAYDDQSVAVFNYSGNYYFLDGQKYFTDTNTTYTVKIIDPNSINSSNTGSTTNTESGCDMYDKVYDTSLIHGYYVESATGVYPPVSCHTTDVYQTVITERGQPFRRYVATYDPNIDGKLISTAIYGSGTNTAFTDMKDVRKINCSQYKFGLPNGNPMSEFRNGVYYIVPGTQSSGRLNGILLEYYRRKRVGKMFCGGIVNYGFIDNWLSGSLYFFQFKVRRITKGAENLIKYCRDLVRYVDGQSRFYYRSAPFNATTNTFLGITHPTTFVDLGPRDEFIKEICIDESLDPNCSVSRSIGPTSHQNFGELLGLAINYRMQSDLSFGLDDFFTNGGSFKSAGFENVFDGDLLQSISINCETGIEEFDLQSPKYVGYDFEYLDPTFYPQFFKKNYSGGTSGYWGPLPVTFELSHDGDRVRSCLNEPTHYDYYGNLVQGRLTESSQPVPFFYWDKKGTGFGGTSAATSDDQSWDFSTIRVQPLQGMTTYISGTTYGYTYNGMYDDDSDKYLLLPFTDDFSGITINNLNLTDVLEFDVISISSGYTAHNSEYPGFTYLYVTGGTQTSPTSGRLFIRVGPAGNDTSDPMSGATGWQSIYWDNNVDFILPQRMDYYSGVTKQILSTPFQFYFGLRHGKTGLDKFIDAFGPKGAFVEPTEVYTYLEYSSIGVSPTPTPTMQGTTTPTPTPNVTPTPTNTPSPTTT
jgi:hypothetical protein